MENKSSAVLLSFLTISCSVLASAQAKNTLTRLDNLHKYKFFNKDMYHSSYDTSLFQVNDKHAMSDYRFKITEQKKFRDGDKIERLPGQPHVKFEQYGGYVTVDEVAGRAFYYYFVAAEKAKHSKPLLLWLNGVANMLFLESYSNTSTDTQNGGDRKTAEDNTLFLLNWLERFPEYKDRDFYIAGESYAGHFVPQLAHNVLFHNKKANKTLVKLGGILLIVNAVINDETDIVGMYEFFNTHAIVSDEITTQIKKTCDFSGIPLSHECSIATADTDVATNNIDIIVCATTSTSLPIRMEPL